MHSLDHLRKVKKLYKVIMRLHRGLPDDLQVLGTNYARDEFKRHKNCQAHEAQIFLNEWTDYAITLAHQLKPLEAAKKKVLGKYMDPSMIDTMRDEQVAQLYQLAKEALKEVKDDKS